MKPRNDSFFHLRPSCLKSALVATISATQALQPASADLTWNGSIDADWFKAGNWSNDDGSYDYRRILAGGDVVLAGGIAPTGSLTHLGKLTIDGALGPAELQTRRLSLIGGTLAIVNGGRLLPYDSESSSVFEFNYAANLLVSGINADGRRSAVLDGDFFDVGRRGYRDNLIRVEDGGLIRVESIWLFGRPGKNTGSSLIVSGVHASGVASTVEAGRVALGLLRNMTAKIEVLDGGVLKVDSLTSYREGASIGIDGGTLVMKKGGYLTGLEPVPFVIGEKGMWADTAKHVVVNGAWTQGVGSLHKIGSGTLELRGANLHGGGTLVHEGTLLLDGEEATLSGGVKIFQGASLGGSGSIGGDLVNEGTLSPGQSSGILRIGGNFEQSASGTLNLEVAANGPSDLLLVGGNAMLGGTLKVENLGEAPDFGKLNLLRADKMEGSFREVEFVGFDDIRTAIESDGGTMFLVVAPASYTEVARDANERSIAAALDLWIADPSGDRSTVVRHLDRLAEEEYAQAFAAVSPAWIHVTDELLTQLLRNQSFLLDRRLDGRRLMRAASGAGANEWDPWGFTYGMFSHEHTLSSFDGDIASGGLLAGMDRAIDESLVAGGFVAYGAGEADMARFGDSSVRSLVAGVYATYEQQGFHGNATFGFGRHDENSDREIRFGGIQRVARADGDGTGAFGSVTGGYSFEAKGWKLGPAAGLFADYTHFNSLTEAGAGALDLLVESHSAESLRGLIGLETSYEHRLPGGFLLVPQTSLFWSHEFLDDAGNFDATLEAGRGGGFTYGPSGREENTILVSTALNVLTPWNLHGAVGYHAGFGFDGSLDQTATIGVDWPF